jgi:Snf7
MYEAQITQLSQQTFNMESAALATENLRNTMATVDAMQIANKEMRKQYGKLDVDQIEVSEGGVTTTSFMTHLFFFSFWWMEDRIFIMIWKIYWNRPMKFKQR